MKIAWFTPFFLESSVGEISKLVCEELQKVFQLDIFTSNTEDLISSSLPVIRFKSANFDYTQLQRYDHIVYNMGNFAGNHREIWEVMQRYPGIIILHDQLMQNFFQQYTMVPDYGGNTVRGEQEYLNLMRTCYGEQGEEAGKALFTSYMGSDPQRIWDSDAAMNYPLLQPVLAKATAVFSHAGFFIEILKSLFYGPAGYAYLPHAIISDRKDVHIAEEFTKGTKTLVVSTGLVHPVKRIAQVAEMLMAYPDIASKVNYVVIGDYGGPYGDYLYSLAHGPLKGCLYLLGFQPTEVMNAYLQEADFCVNLRYPNSEVCSKSLIDQMSFGNPVIALNFGIFNEIPNDCILKIHLENEILELANAFRILVDNIDKRKEIGERAAEFTAENCTPGKYASRFKSFLDNIPQTIVKKRLVNETIYLNRLALNDLSFNQKNIPRLFDTVYRELSNVTCAIPANLIEREVIGVWFGFPYIVGLRREGITRFLLYMIQALLINYSVECEIWSYSFNYEEIRASFEPLLNSKEFENRIKVVTELNYRETLFIPANKNELPYNINETQDNLSYLAKLYSKASCFITAIVYLDNVIGTGKPIFVPVHDLGIHVHYDDFILMDPLYKARHVDIRSRAENLARSGAFLFCESEHVRQEQVLKYIAGINESRTDVIYFPPFVPNNIEKYILDERLVRQKFGLKNPYLFYPTQVRPYKNVLVLIQALSILRDRNHNIDLVLTGTPSDVPAVEDAINKNKLNDKIICLSDTKENELFSLYRYAAVATIPTLFEGGFPLQAMEALYIGTPLVLSDIPVVQERIKFHQMSLDDCGLELFDPHSQLECADAIERVILNREKILANQKHFTEKFLSYSWKDAAVEYYHMFFKYS